MIRRLDSESESQRPVGFRHFASEQAVHRGARDGALKLAKGGERGPGTALSGVQLFRARNEVMSAMNYETPKQRKSWVIALRALAGHPHTHRRGSCVPACVRLSLAAFCFALSACVTINVYFPAAAAEKAADKIIEDVFPLAAPAFGACKVTTPKFNPTSFCEKAELEGVSRTVLVPTMIKLPIRFPDLDYDLTNLEQLGYGGSPIAPELIRRVRKVFPHLELLQVYWSSETGFLTGLQDDGHTPQRLLSCDRPDPGIEVRVVDES